jgi:two-component sensor histidine kinase
LQSAIRSLEAEIAQRRDAEERLVDVQQSLAEKRRTAQALESSLREKEVLLMEIHHRVKNNLQVMASLLHLQGAYVEGAAARAALEESEARIRCMALIHEKLYSSKDLASIEFGGYLRDLVASLIESHRPITTRVVIDVAADPVRLETDRAIPCGLVLNELISNSLKHGYPDGRAGRVRVAMTGDAATGIRLTVRDDGVGWPAQFDPSRSASMGLKLVYILAKQLRGDLTFHCHDGIECRLRLQPESVRPDSVQPDSVQPDAERPQSARLQVGRKWDSWPAEGSP